MGKKATLLLGKILFGFITIVVAVLAILGWLAGVIDPETSWFIALIALGMMPLILMNLLFLVIWAIKRSWMCVVPIIAILINVGYIKAVVQFDFRNTDKLPPVALKMATYNIHGQGHKDFGGVMKNVLSDFNAQRVDIVCFQEFSDVPTENMDSLNTHYPHYVVMSNYKYMKLALFSKYPIEESHVFNFDSTANCFMWVNVKTPSGTTKVINVHLQTTNINQSQNEILQIKDLGLENRDGKIAFDKVMDRLAQNASLRAKQVEAVKREIKLAGDMPVVLCGDFNDIPSSYTYRQFQAAGLEDGFIASGKGYAYTFAPMARILRLDYILHSKHYIAVDYLLPKYGWSDHNPVIMGMSVGM